MKKIYFFILLAVALGVAACSDGGNGGVQENDAKLIGEWDLVSEEGWEIYDDIKDIYKGPDEGYEETHVFKSDYSGVITITGPNDIYEEDFSWWTRDNLLMVTEDEGYPFVFQYTIVALTETTLIVELSDEWENEEGIYEAYYYRSTFNKR